MSYAALVCIHAALLYLSKWNLLISYLDRWQWVERTRGIEFHTPPKSEPAFIGLFVEARTELLRRHTIFDAKPVAPLIPVCCYPVICEVDPELVCPL